jgi:hypothetical protein
MNIKGKIKVINPTNVVSDKFSKREFVVETEETYPQPELIQLTKDKCSLLDLFKVGQEVEVSVNLKGREWVNPISGETKYFNTIEAWRINSGTSTPQTSTPKASGIASNFQEDVIIDMIDMQDHNLPF